MKAGESLEGSFQVIKLLNRRPSQWEQCIAIGRLKFEKYFKRKVKKQNKRQLVFFFFKNYKHMFTSTLVLMID